MHIYVCLVEFSVQINVDPLTPNTFDIHAWLIQTLFVFVFLASRIHERKQRRFRQGRGVVVIDPTASHILVTKCCRRCFTKSSSDSYLWLLLFLFVVALLFVCKVLCIQVL